MRRYATILNHRSAGFVANAMVVWDVNDERGEEIGTKAAEFSAVSHCYLRPRHEGWNYNLFTMTHASSPQELETTIAAMKTEIGAKNHFVLTSLHEYKKVRIRYFTPETYEWEEMCGFL
jgi:DNA-binding Lrp family transcriptional regulator